MILQKVYQQFDEIILLEIYPARELPMEGITSSWLLNKIENKNKRLLSKENLLEELQKTEANIVVTIGAGDIGEMVLEIKNTLQHKK
jgi:UDP-N-acetylmuramate--alanine ligase